MAVIYLITNTKNNKKYVGVTTNFYNRIKGHKCSPNYLMKPDIDKFGWSNFNKVIIFEGTGRLRQCIRYILNGRTYKNTGGPIKGVDY